MFRILLKVGQGEAQELTAESYAGARALIAAGLMNEPTAHAELQQRIVIDHDTGPREGWGIVAFFDAQSPDGRTASNLTVDEILADYADMAPAPAVTGRIIVHADADGVRWTFDVDRINAALIGIGRPDLCIRPEGGE